MTSKSDAQGPPRPRREIPLAPAGPAPAPGAAKAFEPEDPMQLTGVMLPGGDLEEQLEAVVLEYLMLGWNERQIMLLFRRPVFAGTYQVGQALGEEKVQETVHRLYGEWSRGWLRGGAHNG